MIQAYFQEYFSSAKILTQKLLKKRGKGGNGDGEQVLTVILRGSDAVW